VASTIDEVQGILQRNIHANGDRRLYKSVMKSKEAIENILGRLNRDVDELEPFEPRESVSPQIDHSLKFQLRVQTIKAEVVRELLQALAEEEVNKETQEEESFINLVESPQRLPTGPSTQMYQPIAASPLGDPEWTIDGPSRRPRKKRNRKSHPYTMRSWHEDHEPVTEAGLPLINASNEDNFQQAYENEMELCETSGHRGVLQNEESNQCPADPNVLILD